MLGALQMRGIRHDELIDANGRSKSRKPFANIAFEGGIQDGPDHDSKVSADYALTSILPLEPSSPSVNVEDNFSMAVVAAAALASTFLAAAAVAFGRTG
jgi:hypothetical protein